MSEAELAKLEGWDWPGNVRELSNVLGRAALFEGGSIEELLANSFREMRRKTMERESAMRDGLFAFIITTLSPWFLGGVRHLKFVFAPIYGHGDNMVIMGDR